MRKLILLLAIFISFSARSQNAYKEAWDYLNKNNWTSASNSLTDALRDPASSADAFITNIYLQSYRGQEDDIKDFAGSFYKKVSNPYPYIYALWFNDAVLGPSGKKNYPHQLALLNQLLDDPKLPGTLHASINHQVSMHYLFSNEISKSRTFINDIGVIHNWQFAGPFENISQSGYYKDYGPLSNPKPDAVFKSLTYADVKWFTPASELQDAWTPATYQFENSTAVIYAQTFVMSETDQEVYCCAGTSGSLKVWLNDELLVAEPEERTTEMDCYITKCNLKKGVNRLLVQLGYTGNSYPSFSIRLTDNTFHPVKGLKGSPVYAPYPVSTEKRKNVLIPVFAETFFKDKISAEPENLLNYLLLADVYQRNGQIINARNILADAVKKAPENCLLKMKMAEALTKENNRTLLLEEVEKIKQLDPDCLLVMELNIKELLKNQKYEELSTLLEKRIARFGEDESTAGYKLAVLVQEKKYEELVKEVERLYKKYPANQDVLEMMYAVKKNVYKDKKGAMALFEKFFKDNYSYKVYGNYATELEEQGDNDKALRIRQKLAADFPYSPQEFNTLAKYHYGAKQYDKAEEYIRMALDLAPYSESYWEMLGDVLSEKQKVIEATAAYNKSLLYNPKQFIIINKIRKLKGKKEAYELVMQPEVDPVIKADDQSKAKNTDYGYYYILDQKDVILQPGGAAEEYYLTIIRITNQKGVDRYKESSISYGNSQTLLIEKAEVVKKNGARLDGEKNDNEIVFTNLEAGDVIIFKYRIRNYTYGRLAKHFWDHYYFGGQIYTSLTHYSVLVPEGQEFYYTFNNHTLKPEITDVENFKKYTWEIKENEPDKDEPLMPPLSDVSPTLHVSTVASWNEIANWYSDISNTKEEEDIEIGRLYHELFPDEQKKLTQFQKAKIIYQYISENIRYSSVSFRQSAFVPQRPALTLTTRLGDCKDLSSLFVTLARMAGINAQMVLVNTRDNGQKEIMLPGVEFNHCIVKAELDSKVYYIELTDNYLPFNALPNNDIGAVILEIPYKKTTDKASLQLLQGEGRQRDVVKRYMEIKPSGNDLSVSVNTVKYGAASSATRTNYLNLDNDKLVKKLEESVAGSYKNNLKMLSASVKNLDKLYDSVEYSYSYLVKNEVAEIGSMKTFRITYPDVVASLSQFTAESRKYPVEYWSYEDIDQYETRITIQAPAGTKFVELPASENLAYNGIRYSLEYVLKAPDKLIVTRKFISPRQNIAPSEYKAFKEFFEKIVRAEQKFIAYK